MSYGQTADDRRHNAQKHASVLHECGLCGKLVFGNGYYNHKRSCVRIHAIEQGLSPNSATYNEVLEAMRNEFRKAMRDGNGHELDAPETPDNDIDERWQRQSDREDHNAARQHPSGL